MKTLFVILIFVGILVGQERLEQRKQFKVTFSVTFDSLTLLQAGTIEDSLRYKFNLKYRKTVDVKVEEMPKEKDRTPIIYLDSIVPYNPYRFKLHTVPNYLRRVSL